MFTRDVKIFQKRMSHHRFLGARRRGTWSKFHAEVPQVFGASVLNLADMAPGRCAPLVFTAFKILEIIALCLQQIWIWHRVAVCFAMNRFPENPVCALGAFAKLRKATISFVMSVCLSALNNSGFHWKDFHEIWHLSIFRKSVEKIEVSLKSDGDNRTLRED
jgi:hypothetical protein